MSVNVGSYTAAAGQMISVLDAVLVTNAFWSIYDASAGTNQKVYCCQGDGKTFYVDVHDNQADYFTIYLWEGWNAVSHTGTGINVYVYMRKVAGAYKIVLRDTYFAYLTYGANSTHIYYCGQPVLYNSAQNSPILIGHGAAAQTGDPIGMLFPYSPSAWWRSLRLATAQTENIYSYAYDSASTAAKFYSPKTSRNMIMPERPILYGSDTMLFGYLDGVWAAGYGVGAVPPTGQTFLFDGVLWLAHYTARVTFVRLQ